LEIGYRSNSVSKLSSTAGTASGAGNVNNLSFMINGLYDFPIASSFGLHVGVGVGGADLDFSKVGVTNSAALINKTDTVFAYQGIAGVDYKLNKAFSLFTDYHYMGTQDAKVRDNNNNEDKIGYGSHSVLAGLRYAFNTPKPVPVAESEPPPPPPPPPVYRAPAPAPVASAPVSAPVVIARNYVVFFDFDKAVLTQGALGILSSAAANAGKVHVVSIEVTGHTDLSGTPKYNMDLSMKRALAVKAELMRLGLPESEINIQAKGKSEPLVPTADGAREPQNRRVEIVLK
ncbi:MAG: OmpA family protein, partial [Alphaproteobacteria bacterium]|nr:OmpA family protein [Alphaproteobacteria bacterium]